MSRCGVCLLLVWLSSSIARADWPEFRGPGGRGIYDGPELPIEWGTDKNVAWKQKIPGRGWSSPAVRQGRIYLTTAVAANPADPKSDQSLRALCVDAKSGKILWNVQVFHQDGKTASESHSKNSHASPTAIVDAERVYVHYGHQGTAALSLEGKPLWNTREHAYVPRHGNGGSPILVDDKLIFSCDGSDVQKVVALDAKTGNTAWTTDRQTNAKLTFSFSTPLSIEVDGRKQVLSPASDFVAAYDVTAGEEQWRVCYPQPGWSVIPQPVAGQGLVFVCTGWANQHLLAIRPGGRGDVTKDRLSWSMRRNAPNTPTPLLVGDQLYVLADGGILTCVNAKSGKVHWSERVPGAYSASPICANGKIYITNETGVGMVLEAGTEFKELARSDLKEKTFATFAPVDGALFVRTETQLYRFEKK